MFHTKFYRHEILYLSCISSGLKLSDVSDINVRYEWLMRMRADEVAQNAISHFKVEFAHLSWITVYRLTTSGNAPLLLRRINLIRYLIS